MQLESDWYRSWPAKEQVKNVSEVVREGIQDVRGSSIALWPGSSEGRTQRCFRKDDSWVSESSNLQVDLIYEWVDVDMDVMIEDTIFVWFKNSYTVRFVTAMLV